MAGSRTLKLSILADTADLVKGLKQAEDTSSTFGDKLGGAFRAVGVAAAAAGAAIGALAIKSAVDGVKAALDDEKAQRILAQTLENTTGATNNQIAAVESYITQTSLAVGVTDDKLRPAFSRLIRSTKDTEEATKLLNLALDISSATGKPLEAIANSLGKAYDGNTNALGRLGLGIDQSILKTKDFDLVYNTLKTSFAGFSANEAQTFQGRIDRLNVAFDEAKETIGFALLPQLEKLSKFMTDSGVPALNAFVAGLTGQKGISVATEYAGRRIDSFEPKISNIEKAANLAGIKVSELGARIGKLFSSVDELTGGKGNALEGFAKTLNVITKSADLLVAAIEKIVEALTAIKRFFENPVQLQTGFTKFLEFLVTLRKSLVGDFTAPVIPPQFSARRSSFETPAIETASASVGMFASSVPSLGLEGITAFDEQLRAFLGQPSGITNNITVNGAIDSESTARQIVDLLNESNQRGTIGGGGILV
jgi:hypothetical protein